MSLRDYIHIARPSHWFKNAFMLPGVAIAFLLTDATFEEKIASILIAFLSLCVIASANYVLNEWLDAETDRFHPLKKSRPAVANKLKRSVVYIEYLGLGLLGLLLATFVSEPFFLTSVIFLFMGILYNVKPFRTKDRIYLDVLSESINNPLRLMLGWFSVSADTFPPTSLLVGYWMGGGFLMAIKRYAEYRFIIDKGDASLYRRSFKYYTEEKLLTSSFFYAMCSGFFLGVFLIKYRIELLFSLPLFAILFVWYFHIGMKPQSIAQNPEKLYQEKAFIIYVFLLVGAVGVLLFADMPWLHWFLKNAFLPDGS